MKNIALLTVIFVLFSISLTNCERLESSKRSFDNSTLNAEIVKFVPEKRFCMWGWKIKVGDQIIMADSLPDIELIGYTINNPIPVIIETGNIKINCGEGPDYFEIKTLIIK